MRDAIYSATSALLLAVIGWAANLGTRLTTVETKVEAQPKRDDELKGYLKDLLDAKFDGLDARLARIEANGNGKASHAG